MTRFPWPVPKPITLHGKVRFRSVADCRQGSQEIDYYPSVDVAERALLEGLREGKLVLARIREAGQNLSTLERIGEEARELWT